MTPEELNTFLGTTSIILGIISIGVAVSLTIFIIRRDNSRRKKEEQFYANEIKQNLKAITQYFLSIDSISKDYRGFDDEEKETISSLHDFYVRSHQEMVDLLHITKLYLTQWRSLDENKKNMIKQVLEKFSWLAYEYYPLHLPASIRENRWQQKLEAFDENKSIVTTNVSGILEYA